MAVYVGRTASSSPGRVSSSPRSSAASSAGTTSSRSRGKPAVREAERELCGALAADDDPAGALQEWLEVDVPDPGHVAPVGDPVVQRDDQRRWRGSVVERPDRLVRARRVLDEEQEDALVADHEALEAAERAA